MKLSELGLKSKPQTKYFEGGYTSFHTSLDELFAEIYQVTKETNSKLVQLKIMSKIQLEKMMESKTLEDMLINAVIQA